MARKFYRENNEPIPAIVFELSAPTGFTEITDQSEIKMLYIKQYRIRIEDGQNWVLDFTAERYLDFLNGVYTDSEVFALESHTKDLYSELNNGLWLTAQNTNQNLEFSGIYDQTMKNQIQATINQYINENY